VIDLVVIGAGSGGLVAAKRAALGGKRVILIEGDTIGGTCVSYGCVPKKLWHAISHGGHHMSIAKAHGWDVSNPSFNWETIQPRLMAFIQSLNERHYNTCKSAGVEFIRGYASFESPTSVRVNGDTYSTNHSLIAVGGQSVIQDIPGANLCETSYNFFNWQQQPASVAIWGGGYIAVELASILNALGTTVHLIIRQSRVLRGFDDDMRKWLHEQYQARGIIIHSDTTIQSIEAHVNQKKVILNNGETICVDNVLQALGRRPNTDRLNCEQVGVKRAPDGAIVVNDQYQTDCPQISALGDCIGGVQLTPVAIAQAREWVDHVLFNRSFAVDYQCIPTAVFSHPEAASVGLTEAEARQKHAIVHTKMMAFRPLTMMLSDHQEKVWIKLVFVGSDDRVMGIHMAGDASAEIIQSLAVSVQKGITKADLDLTMALHPSVTEELVTIY
jgi:glutathione reductase (NADPH)